MFCLVYKELRQSLPSQVIDRQYSNMNTLVVLSTLVFLHGCIYRSFSMPVSDDTGKRSVSMDTPALIDAINSLEIVIKQTVISHFMCMSIIILSLTFSFTVSHAWI